VFNIYFIHRLTVDPHPLKIKKKQKNKKKKKQYTTHNIYKTLTPSSGNVISNIFLISLDILISLDSISLEYSNARSEKSLKTD